MPQDIIKSDQAKASTDNISFGVDVKQVALNNEKGSAATLSPEDQDQALADQEQLALDQDEIAADQHEVYQDQRQGDKEEEIEEDQALKMVKTLVDKATRS